MCFHIMEKIKIVLFSLQISLNSLQLCKTWQVQQMRDRHNSSFLRVTTRYAENLMVPFFSPYNLVFSLSSIQNMYQRCQTHWSSLFHRLLPTFHFLLFFLFLEKKGHRAISVNHCLTAKVENRKRVRKDVGEENVLKDSMGLDLLRAGIGHT